MGKFQIPTDSDALVDKDKITKERKYEQNDSSCSNKNDMIKTDGKKDQFDNDDNNNNITNICNAHIVDKLNLYNPPKTGTRTFIFWFSTLFIYLFRTALLRCNNFS